MRIISEEILATLSSGGKGLLSSESKQDPTASFSLTPLTISVYYRHIQHAECLPDPPNGTQSILKGPTLKDTKLSLFAFHGTST